jgi:hypothetical protein
VRFNKLALEKLKLSAIKSATKFFGIFMNVVNGIKGLLVEVISTRLACAIAYNILKAENTLVGNNHPQGKK